MVFILIKDNIIFNTCDSVNALYMLILTYARIILFCDKSKIIFFNDLKIIEYCENIPNNSYRIDINTLDIFDENGTQLPINNMTIRNIKMELEILLKNNTESDIPIILPPIQTNNNQSEDIINIFDHNEVKKCLLEKDLEILQAKFAAEKIKLEKFDIEHTLKQDKLAELTAEFTMIANKEKIIDDKEIEKKRIFNADRKIYMTITDEIKKKQKKISEVPELFKKKYAIFNKIRLENEEITETEEYIKFNELFANDTNNYDEMFNNSVYDQLYTVDSKDKTINNEEINNEIISENKNITKKPKRKKIERKSKVNE